MWISWVLLAIIYIFVSVVLMTYKTNKDYMLMIALIIFAPITLLVFAIYMLIEKEVL